MKGVSGLQGGGGCMTANRGRGWVGTVRWVQASVQQQKGICGWDRQVPCPKARQPACHCYGACSMAPAVYASIQHESKRAASPGTHETSTSSQSAASAPPSVSTRSSARSSSLAAVRRSAASRCVLMLTSQPSESCAPDAEWQQAPVPAPRVCPWRGRRLPLATQQVTDGEHCRFARSTEHPTSLAGAQIEARRALALLASAGAGSGGPPVSGMRSR